MIEERRIYAGDTPLAWTGRVEQTGPLELTVRAGTCTTTGEARLRPPGPDDAAEIAAGRAERHEDGVRLRAWLLDVAGQPRAPKRTLVLAADHVLLLAPHATRPREVCADLGWLDGVPNVLVRTRLDDWPAPPAGWETALALVLPFTLSPGATDLADIPVPVLVVVPGFPPGTTAADWQVQHGRVEDGP